jgi:geranylgeranyl diphosphate synthase type I
MDGPEILFKYRGQVEAEVLDFLREGTTQVDEMLRYQMGWSDGQLTNLGKCLRPTFFLLACESLSGDLKQTLPVAVGIEFVHNFSLIHDDIEDGDDIRHHRATTWAQFGRDPAILGGVALWNEAYRVISTALSRGMAPERVLQARRILNQTCSEIIEGQHQDLSFETRNDVSLAEYIQMIGRKSAALFGTSLKLGALAAGASDEEAARFDTYGRQLGLAFQIRDDILGIWGEGSATGKPVGADIARRKKSLPVLHAFEQAVGKDRAFLLDVYSRESVDDADVNDVLEILQRWNCRYFAQGLAEDYRSKAMDALSKTNIPWEFRLNFDALTSFILERDY